MIIHKYIYVFAYFEDDRGSKPSSTHPPTTSCSSQMAYLKGRVPQPGDLVGLGEDLVEAGQLVADVADGLAHVREAVEVAALGLEIADLVPLLLQVVLQSLRGEQREDFQSPVSFI